jgi:hypothetical protein
MYNYLTKNKAFVQGEKRKKIGGRVRWVIRHLCETLSNQGN